MNKTILFFIAILFSGITFSKDLLLENESRSLDEAMLTVEKSKMDRKSFDVDKFKREIASEVDPKFDRAFEKLMKDLEQN